MTLWSRAKAGLVRLWQMSALTVRQALSQVNDERHKQVGEAYLLHPRCCRTEQNWESL
jgi:hypothetical protein